MITNVVSWSERDNLPKQSVRRNDVVPVHGSITYTTFQKVFLVYCEINDLRNWLGNNLVENFGNPCPAIVAQKINTITVPTRTIYKTVRGRSFNVQRQNYNYDNSIDLMLGGKREILG